MQIASQSSDNLYFISGGGEMGALIRAYDWSTTSLGDPEDWPQSLKFAVSLMLDNPFGMYIAWGDDFIQLYNDSYRPILGSTKHPQALGISTRDTFSEIWYIIGSMFDDVMKGKAVGFPDFMLPLNRDGFTEECYFDFSYSPIRKENGEVGGVLVTVIETTNKKKSEKALKISEERFRTMADNIPNLAWMADANGWIFWYNKKWYEYTGTTPEQMEGWGWQSVHDPEELPKVLLKWNSSILNGEAFEMVFPLKRADGKFHQFLTRVLPVFDNDDNICQWFGTNTDITEQVETERFLKESEQRFRTMAEATDVLIAVGDEKGNAVYFNQAWSDLTGLPMDELIDYGWTERIHDEDRQKVLADYSIAFEKKQTWADEFRILNKHGEYRWLLGKSTQRSDHGSFFGGYVSSCIDITERKIAEKAALENERNLRNTILQAPVAMCIFKGPHYIVELANERMFELWGKPAASILNKPVFEGIPEAKGQGFEVLLDGVYRTGKTFAAQDVPVTLPRYGKIETVYVNLVYEAYHEPDGSISGVLAVAVDVTAQFIARRQIEEVVNERTKELADTNQHLKRSNAELAQFAYIASHDLQEPLRKISIFTKMLESRMNPEVDELSINYINKIITSVSRMNVLIRDVLTYSEMIKEKDAFVEVDLNQIVENIKADYDLLIEQKAASVFYKHLPVIEGISVQIFQVFSNIIGNALKFTRPGVKPVITISAEKLSIAEVRDNKLLSNDIEYYKFVFTDNGIGMKKEYVDQIFSIFKRLHSKSEYEGTGIGLAMCKKIVENHHGDLNALESTEHGAVFNVILPAKQIRDAELRYIEQVN